MRAHAAGNVPVWTKRDKGSKQRGVMIAAGALLTISAIKIGLELHTKEESFYDMMEVPPTASTIDIKKGFKRASLKVRLTHSNLRRRLLQTS